MMSICLQSMVDELMVKKSGGSIKKVSLPLVCLPNSTCRIPMKLFQYVFVSMKRELCQHLKKKSETEIYCKIKKFIPVKYIFK